MDLKSHYDKLYSESIEKYRSLNIEIDDQINSKTDNRYGITLLIRPSEFVKDNIQYFINKLRVIEPDQYFYRNSDIHITVLSIISCYNGFGLSQINVEDYKNLIQRSIADSRKFKIYFKGITAASSGILIQGFPSDDTLNNIREKLRENFTSSNLEQSIDKRYIVKTAHSTIVRFNKQIKNTAEFIKVLENYREFDFGSFDVDNLEFVGNDWYQRIEKVKSLASFSLL